MCKTKKVIGEVKKALEKYSSDNVDVTRNEFTNMLDITFHSRNNSFPIVAGVARCEDVNKKKLIKELNFLHVGYCW